MEENLQSKFDERLKELLVLAKRKKNVLEYQEINDFFNDEDDNIDEKLKPSMGAGEYVKDFAKSLTFCAEKLSPLQASIRI